ncbi:MAG: HAD family hydrolase [Blautia massiliensis (ex Durand et al. 2017)]|uniref:HAD family hydrolase n=1 Tax=Blautia massiliensis (ex Durand et al. 2017) TaxID=1737424 RepID=UPI0039933ECC
MIKVIASDMDGTLLGDDHRIAPETLAAIRRACDAGIRFMVATGRNFPGAMEELKGTELTCDYVVSSGAEVRNPQQEVIKSTPISIELCEEVYNTAKKYPVSVAFLRIATITVLEQRRKLKTGSFSRSVFSIWT